MRARCLVCEREFGVQDVVAIVLRARVLTSDGLCQACLAAVVGAKRGE